MTTILYATDCSQVASTSLKYAFRLSKVLKVDLHVVHVYDLPAFTTTAVRSRGVLEENYFQEQNDILTNYCKQHLQHEMGHHKLHLHTKKNSSISKAILNTAQRINADLVLTGVKNLNTLRGFLTDNIANELMKNLECPMLILPDEFDYNGLSTLLYATDFEESDIYALESLVELVEPYGTLLKIIHIASERENDIDVKMESFKKAVSRRISYPEIVFSMQRFEDVESGIHQYIDKDKPEMLVMMEREQGSFWGSLLHKDMVKTMEGKISIPLLVFNRKSIKAKLVEQRRDTLAFEII